MARFLRVSAGFGLIVAGLFMLVLPGPGIITILAGLALLSRDIAWAGRLANWVKVRFTGGTDEPSPRPQAGG